jgi:glycine hydroxymethyltransferase
VTSGLRLGSAAQTTAGMGPQEMDRIAGLIGRALRQREDDDALLAVRGEVLELCGGFPPYRDLVSGASGRSPAGGR